MALSVDATPLSFRAASRHEEILCTLEFTGRLSISGLESRLGVTAVTIRGNLERLEEQDHLTRTCGGALGKPGHGVHPEILMRLQDLEIETVDPDSHRGSARPGADLRQNQTDCWMHFVQFLRG